MNEEFITKYEHIIHEIGKKNMLHILDFLDHKQGGFNELKNELKITSTTLILNLEDLQNLGLIENKKDDKRSLYNITPDGHRIFLSLLDICKNIEELNTSEKTVLKSIWKTLSDIGTNEFEYIQNELKIKYDKTFLECVSNPTPLKNILCDVYGHASTSILQNISDEILKNSLSISLSNTNEKKLVQIFAKELI